MKLILELDLTSQYSETSEDVLMAIKALALALLEKVPEHVSLPKSYERLLENEQADELTLAEMAEPFVGSTSDAPPDPRIVARFRVNKGPFDAARCERKTPDRVEFRDGNGDPIKNEIEV